MEYATPPGSSRASLTRCESPFHSGATPNRLPNSCFVPSSPRRGTFSARLTYELLLRAPLRGYASLADSYRQKLIEALHFTYLHGYVLNSQAREAEGFPRAVERKHRRLCSPHHRPSARFIYQACYSPVVTSLLYSNLARLLLVSNGFN